MIKIYVRWDDSEEAKRAVGEMRSRRAGCQRKRDKTAGTVEGRWGDERRWTMDDLIRSSPPPQCTSQRTLTCSCARGGCGSLCMQRGGSDSRDERTYLWNLSSIWSARRRSNA